MKAIRLNDLEILPSFFAVITLIDAFDGAQLSAEFHVIRLGYVVTPILAFISLAVAMIMRRRLTVWLCANIAWLVLWISVIAFLIHFDTTYVWGNTRAFESLAT